MRIVFFDTETTGLDAGDRLCQIAVKERGASAPLAYGLYNPRMPIPQGASRVHGILDAMVADKPAFTEAPEYATVKALFEHENTIAVAHNTVFDCGMLAREDITPRKIICTWKVARALDTEKKLAQYSLQYLRDVLALEASGKAHDALGDVLVMEQLFERLLAKLSLQKGGEDAALLEMIEITRQPVLFTTLRFGKHNGKKIEDVVAEDTPYLEWLLEAKRQNPEREADWIYTLEHYLHSTPTD